MLIPVQNWPRSSLLTREAQCELKDLSLSLIPDTLEPLPSFPVINTSLGGLHTLTIATNCTPIKSVRNLVEEAPYIEKMHLAVDENPNGIDHTELRTPLELSTPHLIELTLEYPQLMIECSKWEAPRLRHLCIVTEQLILTRMSFSFPSLRTLRLIHNTPVSVRNVTIPESAFSRLFLPTLRAIEVPEWNVFEVLVSSLVSHATSDTPALCPVLSMIRVHSAQGALKSNLLRTFISSYPHVQTYAPELLYKSILLAFLHGCSNTQSVWRF